jgi:hypothetical protein
LAGAAPDTGRSFNSRPLGRREAPRQLQLDSLTKWEKCGCLALFFSLLFVG